MASVLPTFLTADELAAVLRCQPEKVYRLAARGELPSCKVEGRRLFDRGEVVRRHQAGLLYQAPPERFGAIAQAWLECYIIGAAGLVWPRPKSIRLAEDCLSALKPLNNLSTERLRDLSSRTSSRRSLSGHRVGPRWRSPS